MDGLTGQPADPDAENGGRGLPGYLVDPANVSPQQFDARFGARIADRLAEVCDLLVLNAKSYRKILAERGM